MNPFYNAPPHRYGWDRRGFAPQASRAHTDVAGFSLESGIAGAGQLKVVVAAVAGYHGYKKYGRAGGAAFAIGAMLAPLITAGVVGYQTMKTGFGKK